MAIYFIGGDLCLISCDLGITNGNVGITTGTLRNIRCHLGITIGVIVLIHVESKLTYECYR